MVDREQHLRPTCQPIQFLPEARVPMLHTKYPQWQEPYQQAMLELDPAKLRQKILDAEAAIYGRLQQLTDGDARKEGAQEKRLAIDDAISGLRVLQTEKLRFPDWKSR